MLIRFVALIAVAAAVFVLVQAGQPIVDQNRKVREWPSVEVQVAAKIDLSEGTPVTQPVTRSSTSPSTQATATTLPTTRASMTAAPSTGAHEPAVVIRYRHDVGGTIYQSFRRRSLKEPFEEREFLEPALSTGGVASYRTRGVYDPAKPEELFLLQPFGLRTYLPIFAAAPLLGIGFGALVMHKRARASVRLARPRLAEGEKGWHRLTPANILPGHRAAGAWGAAIVCNTVVGFALYDYFAALPRAHSPLTDVLAALSVLPGVAILGVAVAFSRSARRHGEVRAWVNEMPAKPGERFAIKCEVPVDPAFADAERMVVVTVKCVNRGKTVWEERTERSVAGRGKQDGRATFEQRFTIPGDVGSRESSENQPERIDGEVRIDESVFLLPVLQKARHGRSAVPRELYRFAISLISTRRSCLGRCTGSSRGSRRSWRRCSGCSG
jgi:hypothetical protein